MELIVTPDYVSLSRVAADRFVAVVKDKPDASLILATGDTPMGMYRELAERRQGGEFDSSAVRVFQLDAYLGLAPDDPRSLYGWMMRAFVEPLGVPAKHVVRLAGDAPDMEAACRAYEAAVQAAGGIDLAVLGLGPNGHLGFNEPPAGADAPTRVVWLTEASIQSNARYWGGQEQVPRAAMTAGMTVLLAARQTLLLVSGAHKREILRRTIAGPVTPDVPASFLHQARNVTVIADQDTWPYG